MATNHHSLLGANQKVNDTTQEERPLPNLTDYTWDWLRMFLG